MAKKRLKIGIVGPGSDPFPGTNYDAGWQWWGINSAYRNAYAPWTKMFNLHRFAHLERDCPQYVDWDLTFSRRNPKVQMVVIDPWRPALRNQVLFPRKALEYQPLSHYHASSFDWLVAYAIHLKADVISLHGPRFALDSPREEPISAQACLEYWLGYAHGNGINILWGRDCELFTQYHLVASRSVYGYDDVRMVERR